jgi:6-phospho-3-hexuloisomerase
MALLKVAQSAGARTAAVTAQPNGEVPGAADTVIHLRAQTMADDKRGRSVLPMGSLYEAAMLVFFDIVSIVLRERTGQTTEGMRSRHTNLE